MTSYAAQFEDVGNISIRATKIESNDQFVVQERSHFALFPSLNFTCTRGHIIRLWFIGRFSGGTSSRLVPNASIRVWIANSATSWSLNGSQILRSATPLIRPHSKEDRLISVEPMDGRFLNFTRGDFIAIRNSNIGRGGYSFLYHRNSGPAIHFYEESPSMPSTLIRNSTDYPLLAVETSKSNYIIIILLVIIILWY